MEKKQANRLVVSGVMIALGTILSFIQVYRLPYGGSITLCSMLPVMLIGYIYGVKWGVFTGMVYGVLQLLVGMDALKGISLQAVIGSIIFDYIIAYGMLGLAGLLRGKIKNGSVALALGTVIASCARFISHLISGYIFFSDYAEWFFSQDGFSMGSSILSKFSGSSLSIIYSAFYNGSYMLPECLITAVVAFIIAGLLRKQISNQQD